MTRAAILLCLLAGSCGDGSSPADAATPADGAVCLAVCSGCAADEVCSTDLGGNAATVLEAACLKRCQAAADCPGGKRCFQAWNAEPGTSPTSTGGPWACVDPAAVRFCGRPAKACNLFGQTCDGATLLEPLQLGPDALDTRLCGMTRGPVCPLGCQAGGCTLADAGASDR